MRCVPERPFWPLARVGWFRSVPAGTGSPLCPPALLLPVAYAMGFSWCTHGASLLKMQPGTPFSRRTSFCTRKISIRQFPRRFWGGLHSLCVSVSSPAPLRRWIPLVNVDAQEKWAACFQQKRHRFGDGCGCAW